MSDLEETLRLSHGAVVEAVALLRHAGAIHAPPKTGKRRDYFSVDSDPCKIMQFFFKDTLAPTLKRAESGLGKMLAMRQEDLGAFACVKIENLANAVSHMARIAALGEK